MEVIVTHALDKGTCRQGLQVGPEMNVLAGLTDESVLGRNK